MQAFVKMVLPRRQSLRIGALIKFAYLTVILAYVSAERGYRCLVAHAPEATSFRSKYHCGAHSHLGFAPRIPDDGAPARSSRPMWKANHAHNQGIPYRLA